jgi:hypothetical protein
VAGQRAKSGAADRREPHRLAAFLIEYIVSAAGSRVGDTEPEPCSYDSANYRSSECAFPPVPILHIRAARDQRQGHYANQNFYRTPQHDFTFLVLVGPPKIGKPTLN